MKKTHRKLSLILIAETSFINFSITLVSSEGGGGGGGGELFIPKWPMIIPIPNPKQAKIALTIAILDADQDMLCFDV